MSQNKYLDESSKVLKQKVSLVLGELVKSFRTGDVRTEEELSKTFGELMTAYREISNRVRFKEAPKVSAGTYADYKEWNKILSRIRQDLILLYIHLQALDKLAVSSFNRQVSELDDLLGRLRRTDGKLADYKIYLGDIGFALGDNFSTTENIDIESELLGATEAEVNTSGAFVSLPIVSSTVINVKKIKLDENTTNGVLGNNEDTNNQYGAQSNLGNIGDQNADTWVEFEKTYYTDETSDPLTVRLILELESERIINQIFIDPVNFGTLEGVVIEDIKVSTDGTSWTTIRGDAPLADYLDESEDTFYTVSPESANYKGVFTYPFLPRRAKYVSCTLVQKYPVGIETSSGVKNRLAIGVKSIDVYSVQYEDSGEIVSSSLSLNAPLWKLGLLSAYIPTTNEIGEVAFSVTVDDGNTWNDIYPLESSVSEEEIVTYDTGNGYQNLRYRISLSRNSEKFEELSSLFEGAGSNPVAFELSKVSLDSSPATITPSKTLASDVVYIFESPVGSRGDDDFAKGRFVIARGTGGPLRVKLPFDIFPKSSNLKSDVSVYVAGKAWTRVNAESTLDAAGAGSQSFYIDNSGYVIFGDGDIRTNTGNSASPRAGAFITAGLTPETLAFSVVDGGYTALLALPSDGDKKSCKLELTTPPASSITEILPVGEDEISLKQAPIDSSTVQIEERNFLGALAATSYVTLEADLADVSSTGDYHIDYEKGILTSSKPAAEDRVTTITYKAYTVSEAEEYEIRQGDSGNYNTVYIPSDAFVSQEWTDTTGAAREPFDKNGKSVAGAHVANVSSSSGKLIRLSQKAVIPGTISLGDGIFDIYTPEEVDFIDGYTELNNAVAVQTENLVSTGASGVYTFSINNGDAFIATYGVKYSDASVFTTPVSTAAAVSGSVGNYYSEPATGLVTVNLGGSGIPEGTTATYAFASGEAPGNGAYSVNYATGLIYCKWTVTDSVDITYKYSKYQFHYIVAKKIPADDVEVDLEANTISLETTRLKKGSIKYSYEYVPLSEEELKELAPYFSPIVRDIRFRVLTEGMI